MSHEALASDCSNVFKLTRRYPDLCTVWKAYHEDDLVFLSRLQHVHDKIKVEDWGRELRLIAKEEGLLCV